MDVSKLSPSDQDNLRREIDIHRSLDCFNIVKFYGAFQEGSFVYLLLEYAENGSLYFFIHSLNGLPESLAVRFLHQVALALLHLHERGLMHRDVKPENVVFDGNFNAKICDFGWTVGVKEDEVRYSICGTFEYMSPEIVNRGAHNPKNDVWALGILLFEMLHGNAPFVAQSVQEMQH